MKLIYKHATKTSAGIISKGWYEHNGERFLIKGNTKNHLEPYSEVMASRIAILLGLEAMEYSLVEAHQYPEIKKFNIPHLSICKTYMRESINQSVSASKYIDAYYGKPVSDFWTAYLKSNLSAVRLFQMLTFDAFVGNTDRHLNNWDILVYNSGEVKEAPLIDSGASLLSQYNINDLNTNWKLGPDKSKPFKPTHTQQMALVNKFRKKAIGNQPYINPIPEEILLEAIENSNRDILEILGQDRSKIIMQYLKNRYHYLGEAMKSV